MRYYSVVISMLMCPRGSREPSKPLDLPDPAEKGSADRISIASARAIARLTRIHQEEYGISRSHPFALYAINLALFVLVGAWRRDLLPDLMTDPDFVGMITAFSVLTTRSVRGHHVRAMFRQSLGPVIPQSDDDVGKLPEALREVLRDDQHGRGGGGSEIASLPSSSGRSSEKDDDDSSEAVADGVSSTPSSEDGNESSGTKEEEEQRSESSDGGDDQSEDGSTLCEMLSRYEELTLGQESRAD